MAPEWFYTSRGQKSGPVSSKELKRLATQGVLLPTDLLWKEGMKDWLPASKAKNLFANESSGTGGDPAGQQPPPQDSLSTSEPANATEAPVTLGARMRNAARVTALKAEQAKLRNVSLPAAYVVLGKHLHAAQTLNEQFPDLYKQIDDLQAKAAEASKKAAEATGTNLAKKAKVFAQKGAAFAKGKAAEVQQLAVFKQLGEHASQPANAHRIDAASLEPLRTIQGRIESIENEMATLQASKETQDSFAAADAKLQSLHRVFGGQWTRRLAIGAGILATLYMVAGVLGIGSAARDVRNYSDSETRSCLDVVCSIRRVIQAKSPRLKKGKDPGSFEELKAAVPGWFVDRNRETGRIWLFNDILKYSKLDSVPVSLKDLEAAYGPLAPVTTKQDIGAASVRVSWQMLHDGSDVQQANQKVFKVPCNDGVVFITAQASPSSANMFTGLVRTVSMLLTDDKVTGEEAMAKIDTATSEPTATPQRKPSSVYTATEKKLARNGLKNRGNSLEGLSGLLATFEQLSTSVIAASLWHKTNGEDDDVVLLVELEPTSPTDGSLENPIQTRLRLRGWMQQSSMLMLSMCRQSADLAADLQYGTANGKQYVKTMENGKTDWRIVWVIGPEVAELNCKGTEYRTSPSSRGSETTLRYNGLFTTCGCESFEDSKPSTIAQIKKLLCGGK